MSRLCWFPSRLVLFHLIRLILLAYFSLTRWFSSLLRYYFFSLSLSKTFLTLSFLLFFYLICFCFLLSIFSNLIFLFSPPFHESLFSFILLPFFTLVYNHLPFLPSSSILVLSSSLIFSLPSSSLLPSPASWFASPLTFYYLIFSLCVSSATCRFSSLPLFYLIASYIPFFSFFCGCFAKFVLALSRFL